MSLPRPRNYLDLHLARDVHYLMKMPFWAYTGILQAKLIENKANKLELYYVRSIRLAFGGKKRNRGVPSVINAN